MITRQTMPSNSSSASESFYTVQQQQFNHSVSDSDCSASMIPAQINHAIADDSMTFMTPNTSRCAHENRSAITYEHNDEEEDSVETTLTISIKSFQTAHASFLISPCSIHCKHQTHALAEVQMRNTTGVSVPNTFTRPSTTEPHLQQMQPQLPEARVVYQKLSITPFNKQCNRNQTSNRPPSHIFCENTRIPRGLRPRSSVDQRRHPLRTASLFSPSNQQQQQQQRYPYIIPRIIGNASTPSVTSSSTTRDPAIPRDRGTEVEREVCGSRTLQKSNLSISTASNNVSLPPQSLPQQQTQAQDQIRVRAPQVGSGDGGDGLLSSLNNSNESNKNNMISALFSSQKNGEGGSHKRRSKLCTVSSNTTMSNMGFNMSSLTSSAISGLGSGCATSNKVMQRAEHSSPSPDLSSVGKAKTAVGALVARQDLENIKNNWDTCCNSKDQGKPKTAVGALIALQSRSNRVGGKGKSRSSKSNGRKSLNKNFMYQGKEGNDVSNTRGNMSTLPSWSNGSSGCHSPPMMNEGIVEITPGNSNICTDVGVLSNKDEPNGHANIDGTNNGQSLNTSELSFVPPRRNNQEECNETKFGETNNATFPIVTSRTRISIRSSLHRKNHVKKVKNTDIDGTSGNRCTANDISTSYALSDDSQSKVSQCNNNACGTDYENEEGSTSFSESICHSFNELLKQRQQGNKNNSDKYGSDKNHQQSKISNGNHLPSRSLIEWNEYEKYKEEQERKMSSLPPSSYIEDEENMDEGRRSYSSRHALFESYDSLTGGTAPSNDKPISSYDFSPLQNEIHAGGFCIRDEVTSYMSDISHNSGIQSVEYRFNHKPPRYVEVVTQNSAHSGPSAHPSLSDIYFTGYKSNGVASCPSLTMDAPFLVQQEQDQRPCRKQFGQIVNATPNTCCSA